MSKPISNSELKFIITRCVENFSTFLLDAPRLLSEICSNYDSIGNLFYEQISEKLFSGKSLSRILSLYLLLKSSESQPKLIVKNLAKDNSTLLKLSADSQIPESKGGSYFDDSPTPQNRILGKNFLRLLREAVIFWSGISNNNKNLKLIVENIKKKGSFPIQLYFINKELDPHYDFTTKLYLDLNTSEIQEEPSMEVSIIQNLQSSSSTTTKKRSGQDPSIGHFSATDSTDVTRKDYSKDSNQTKPSPLYSIQEERQTFGRIDRAATIKDVLPTQNDNLIEQKVSTTPALIEKSNINITESAHSNSQHQDLPYFNPKPKVYSKSGKTESNLKQSYQSKDSDLKNHTNQINQIMDRESQNQAFISKQAESNHQNSISNGGNHIISKINKGSLPYGEEQPGSEEDKIENEEKINSSTQQLSKQKISNPFQRNSNQLQNIESSVNFKSSKNIAENNNNNNNNSDNNKNNLQKQYHNKVESQNKQEQQGGMMNMRQSTTDYVKNRFEDTNQNYNKTYSDKVDTPPNDQSPPKKVHQVQSAFGLANKDWNKFNSQGPSQSATQIKNSQGKNNATTATYEQKKAQKNVNFQDQEHKENSSKKEAFSHSDKQADKASNYDYNPPQVNRQNLRLQIGNQKYEDFEEQQMDEQSKFEGSILKYLDDEKQNDQLRSTLQSLDSKNSQGFQFQGRATMNHYFKNPFSSHSSKKSQKELLINNIYEIQDNIERSKIIQEQYAPSYGKDNKKPNFSMLVDPKYDELYESILKDAPGSRFGKKTNQSLNFLFGQRGSLGLSSARGLSSPDKSRSSITSKMKYNDPDKQLLVQIIQQLESKVEQLENKLETSNKK